MQDPYNRNIAKFICSCNSVMVQQSWASDPTRIGVIGKHNQLVLLSPISHKMKTVLHICYHHTMARCMDADYKVWYMLKKKKIKWSLKLSTLQNSFKG